MCLQTCSRFGKAVATIRRRMELSTQTDVAILWKRGDGASCVLSRRGHSLVLTVRMFGTVQQEEHVESPQEAIELARRWRLSTEPA